MKKVIFVCLLTLSVCLSQPAPAEQPSPVTPTKTPPALNGTDTNPPGKDVTPVQPTQSTSQPTNPATKDTDPNNRAPQQPPVTTAGDKIVTTIATPTEVNTKNETATTTTTTIAPDNSKTTTTTIKPDEHTGTTSEAPVPKPTASTPKTVVTSTMQPPTLQARGFDGASFVGGIILTLGLLAIGFMGLKYYRAQTERNYHTL